MAFDIGVWDLHLCLQCFDNWLQYILSRNTSVSHILLLYFFPFRNVAAFTTMAICLCVMDMAYTAVRCLCSPDKLGRTAPLLTTAEMGPYLKCILYIELDGTCSFLRSPWPVWSFSYNLYVYIQPTYYFSTFPTYIVPSGISFMQITYGLPLECCDAMHKIKLSLQLEICNYSMCSEDIELNETQKQQCAKFV